MGPSAVPAQDADQGRGRLRRGQARHGRARAAACGRSDLITRESLENAIAAVTASGGSTNGVLHLLAVATRGRASSSTSTTSTASRARRRCSATSSPAASTSPSTCTTAGGTRGARPAPARARRPARGRADGAPARPSASSPTQAAGDRRASRSSARSSEPLKPTGGLAILRGNLAPEGCVVKLAGHERRHHTGPARVFEGEEAAMDAVTHGGIKPRATSSSSATRARSAGPGMREMLARHRGDQRRRARRGRRAAHRRALLRRHARLHGRPRRARGGARRPDRRGPRRRRDHDRRRRPAHRRRRSTDDEIAARVAAYESPPTPATHRRAGQVRAARSRAPPRAPSRCAEQPTARATPAVGLDVLRARRGTPRAAR